VALTSDGDHEAQLRDARTGEPLGPSLPHGSQVVLAVFLPGGRGVVTGSDDNMARVWSVPGGELLTRPLPHLGSLRYLAPDADGRLLLTASADDTAQVWDIDSGQALTPRLPLNGPVRAAAFSSDSSRVSVSVAGGVQTWDLRPESRPLEEIVRLAELLSACRIDHRHGVLPLSSDHLTELCRQAGAR
jgi:WD40 repeat protein